MNAEADVGAVVRPVHPVLPAPSEAHFEASNTVFVEEFRIRGNEAGPDQRANIITIANLLQVCTTAGMLWLLQSC
jgi:fatty acyl-ACP thioesterase A